MVRRKTSSDRASTFKPDQICKQVLMDTRNVTPDHPADDAAPEYVRRAISNVSHVSSRYLASALIVAVMITVSALTVTSRNLNGVTTERGYRQARPFCGLPGELCENESRSEAFRLATAAED